MLLKQAMGARARLFFVFLVGAVWLAAASGCGSVLYVNQVTRKASSAVEAARLAEAEVYAPYHYTLAVAYLHKAREEAAAADFQAANRFGRLSHEAAEQARALAVQRAADPSDTTWKPPPGTPGHDGSPASDGAGAAEAADVASEGDGEAAAGEGDAEAQPGDGGAEGEGAAEAGEVAGDGGAQETEPESRDAGGEDRE